MKKFLLMVLVIFFTCLDANATTQVFFGNTGQPSYRVSGAYRSTSSVHRFGTNAGFAPQNIRRAQIRNRVINRQKAMTRSAKQCCRRYNTTAHTRTSAPAQISRFNKNYKISTQKTVTRNGVTYYN